MIITYTEKELREILIAHVKRAGLVPFGHTASSTEVPSRVTVKVHVTSEENK